MKLGQFTTAAVLTSILLCGKNVATPLEPLSEESVFGSFMNLGSALRKVGSNMIVGIGGFSI